MSLALVWHHVIVSLRAAAAKLLALLMPIFTKQPPVVCYWYVRTDVGQAVRDVRSSPESLSQGHLPDITLYIQ